MDIRLIIIGVVFVFLLVAFGNNPVSEQPTNAANLPKDPFQRQLQMALDEKTGKGAENERLQAMFPSQMQPTTLNEGAAFGAPSMQQGMGMPAGSAGSFTPPGSYPPGGPSMTNSNSPEWVQRQQAALIPNQPGGAAARAVDVPAFHLKDGRRVFFSGYQVFVLSNDGTLVLLGDGRYQLKTGAPIIIRNGRRQAAE